MFQFKTKKINDLFSYHELVKASFYYEVTKEFLSDIVGTATAAFAMFALNNRYTGCAVNYKIYGVPSISTSVVINAGIFAMKSLITSVSYNIGATSYAIADCVWNNEFIHKTCNAELEPLLDIRNNFKLLGLFAGLEFADINSIDPNKFQFGSKDYLKTRFIVSSFKTLGATIVDIPNILKQGINIFSIGSPFIRAFSGNFFADLVNKFGKFVKLPETIREYVMDSITREFTHISYDKIYEWLFPSLSSTSMGVVIPTKVKEGNLLEEYSNLDQATFDLVEDQYNAIDDTITLKFHAVDQIIRQHVTVYNCKELNCNGFVQFIKNKSEYYDKKIIEDYCTYENATNRYSQT